jgi:hypothetical protein
VSTTTRTLATRADHGRDRSSWAVLYASVGVLLVAVLLVYSGLLVHLTNDHEGRAILPPTVGAGESVSGELRLTDSGLLPVEVFLEPRSGSGLQDTALPGDLSVSVQRASDGAYLYQGPMKTSMGPLEVIQPGQSSLVKVTVGSEDSTASAAVPINFTYFWAARPWLPWWWWIPTTLVIAAFVALGYRRSRSRVA